MAGRSPTGIRSNDGENMGESQYAKDMRREAQAQTDLAAAAYAESVQSRAHAEQAARYNEDAAIAASNAEHYAAEQLEAQLEQNAAVRAHHFAIWRQETLNGQSYERWLKEATPLYAEFNDRWDAWSEAKEDDIAAVGAHREEQARDRFKLGSRMHRMAAKVVEGWDWDWWETTRAAFAITLGLTLLGYFFLGGMKLGDYAHVWALSMLGLFLVITITRMVAVPVAAVHHRRLRNAGAWVTTEKNAFRASFPSVWGSNDSWNGAYAVDKTITSMPREYVNFNDSMLVPIPNRQPKPVDEGSLPEEAQRTRALLDSWRQR